MSEAFSNRVQAIKFQNPLHQWLYDVSPVVLVWILYFYIYYTSMTSLLPQPVLADFLSFDLAATFVGFCHLVAIMTAICFVRVWLTPPGHVGPGWIGSSPGLRPQAPLGISFADLNTFNTPPSILTLLCTGPVAALGWLRASIPFTWQQRLARALPFARLGGASKKDDDSTDHSTADSGGGIPAHTSAHAHHDEEEQLHGHSHAHGGHGGHGHSHGGAHGAPPSVPSPGEESGVLETDQCDKCELERPLRAHHCRHCKRCVLRYDHHCIWANNCVGYHNYRFFLQWISYLMAAVVLCFGLIILASIRGTVFNVAGMPSSTIRASSTEGAIDDFGSSAAPIYGSPARLYYGQRVMSIGDYFNLLICGLVCCGAMFWLRNQLRHHLRISAQNFTTVEEADHVFEMSEAVRLGVAPPTTHRFDHGMLKNFRVILGRYIASWPVPFKLNMGDSPDGYRWITNPMSVAKYSEFFQAMRLKMLEEEAAERAKRSAHMRSMFPGSFGVPGAPGSGAGPIPMMQMPPGMGPAAFVPMNTMSSGSTAPIMTMAQPPQSVQTPVGPSSSVAAAASAASIPGPAAPTMGQFAMQFLSSPSSSSATAVPQSGESGSKSSKGPGGVAVPMNNLIQFPPGTSVAAQQQFMMMQSMMPQMRMYLPQQQQQQQQQQTTGVVGGHGHSHGPGQSCDHSHGGHGHSHGTATVVTETPQPLSSVSVSMPVPAAHSIQFPTFAGQQQRALQGQFAGQSV